MRSYKPFGFGYSTALVYFQSTLNTNHQTIARATSVPITEKMAVAIGVWLF